MSGEHLRCIMNIEQVIFLELISSYLNSSDDVCLPASFDNDLLNVLAEKNFCVPFLYHGAIRCNFKYPEKWRIQSSYTIIDSHRKLQVESEIINILEKNDIRSCVLKGSSVAVNYPNPLSRSMGDIDLLVDKHNYKKAALLFVSEQEFVDNQHDFHIGFVYKMIRIEIHSLCSELTDNEILDSAIVNAINNICYKKLDEFDIPVLTAPYQIISLLTHMIRHYRENEFVFRMFCDWVTTVKNISDDEWNNSVYPLINKSRLDLFADALNIAANKFMHIDMKNKVDNKLPNDVVDALMEELLSFDNIKSDDFLDSNLASLYTLLGNKNENFIVISFKVLNEISYRNFKISKHKLLLPFCWIYIILRYIIRLILGKREIVSCKKMNNIKNRRDYIKYKLGL